MNQTAHIAPLLWSERYFQIGSDSIEWSTHSTRWDRENRFLERHRRLTFNQGGCAISLNVVDLEGSHQTVVVYGKLMKDNEGMVGAFDWPSIIYVGPGAEVLLQIHLFKKYWAINIKFRDII